MQIEICNKKKKKSKESFPQILERIFAICKNDSNFELRDELIDIEKNIKEVHKKIDRQNNLLSQSESLKKDMSKRISLIDSQNETKQIELLDSIGSEL